MYITKFPKDWVRKYIFENVIFVRDNAWIYDRVLKNVFAPKSFEISFYIKSSFILFSVLIFLCPSSCFCTQKYVYTYMYKLYILPHLTGFVYFCPTRSMCCWNSPKLPPESSLERKQDITRICRTILCFIYFIRRLYLYVPFFTYFIKHFLGNKVLDDYISLYYFLCANTFR